MSALIWHIKKLFTWQIGSFAAMPLAFWLQVEWLIWASIISFVLAFCMTMLALVFAD